MTIYVYQLNGYNVPNLMELVPVNGVKDGFGFGIGLVRPHLMGCGNVSME